MVNKNTSLKGFKGIERSIPDIAFQKIADPPGEAREALTAISDKTLLLGLPVRSKTVDQAFEWSDFDLEFIKEPEQEKSHKESLDYLSALFVFPKNLPGQVASSEPILIAAVYEDPETEVPQGVVFTSGGAVTEGFSKDFSSSEDTLFHLLKLAGKNLGLEGGPEPTETLITRHPIEERHSAALKAEAAKTIKAEEAKSKNRGVLSFWIALLLGILVFIAAFYFSENFVP